MFKPGDRVRVREDAPIKGHAPYVWLTKGNCSAARRGASGFVWRTDPELDCVRVEFDDHVLGDVRPFVHEDDLEILSRSIARPEPLTAHAQTGREWVEQHKWVHSKIESDWEPSSIAGGQIEQYTNAPHQTNVIAADLAELEGAVADVCDELTNATERVDALERQVAELAMSHEPTPSPLARRVERVLTDRVGSVLVGYLASLATLIGAAALLCR